MPTSSAICWAWSGGSRASARPSNVSTTSSVPTGTSSDTSVVDAAVVLRGAAGTAVLAPLDDDVEVAAGRELVEVVASDVRVELEPLGDVCGGDTALVLVGEEVDLAARRIAERARDRGDDGRELAWSECRRVHAGILPIRVVQIRCDPEPLHAHLRAGPRGLAPGRRSRAASLDRRPRHGAQRRRSMPATWASSSRSRCPAARSATRSRTASRARSDRSRACRRSASTSPR